MKKTINLLTGFLLLICFVACEKETFNTTLEASKTNSIKKGEPITFKLSLTTAGDSVTWSVNPSANTIIHAWGDSASILFGASGNYTVCATFGNSIATSNISVIDSVYADSAMYTSMLVPGEEIKILLYNWPYGTDSTSRAGLLFLAQTATSYSCINNYLLSEIVADGNSYRLKYNGVRTPGNCIEGTQQAGVADFLYPISEGSSTLSIVVNGTTYSGTIVKTGTKFTIHWPYTKGVTISPTSL